MATGQALTRGTRAAFLCIGGDIFGGVIVIALSLFGVGAILAASAELFQIVKWAGVLYMAYLGYSQIMESRHAKPLDVKQELATSGMASVRAGFLVGVLNPKGILFYVAFLSQFLDPNSSQAVQFVILVATHIVIVAFVLGGYALIAAQARRTFQSPVARRRIGYTGGGFLLGGSVYMAATR